MSEYLCRGLRLDIELKEDGKRIRCELRDDLNLQGVEIWADVGDSSLDQRYHRREAIIISLRRLVAAAIQQHLILDYPGESTNSNAGNTKRVDPPITF